MSWRQSTFRLPTLLALLGFIGLFAALLGDGWWDLLAWVGLAIPAGVSLWALPRRRTARARA